MKTIFVNIILCWFILILSSLYPISSTTTEQEPVINPKIIGGHPAELGSLPYMIAIQQSTNYTFCGGSLINLYHILTAAHCFYYTKKVHFVAGIVDLFNLTGEEQIRYPEKIIVHPEFNDAITGNDIAIAKVQEPFQLTNYIKPIEINTRNPSIGTKCITAGWGRTNAEDRKSHSHALLYVEIDILDTLECRSHWTFYDSLMLCAGDLTSYCDSCLGDSGGPLACSNILVGIVSFGPLKCGSGLPAIYTNVSNYRDWIKTNINATENVELYVATSSTFTFKRTATQLLAVLLSILTIFISNGIINNLI